MYNATPHQNYTVPWDEATTLKCIAYDADRNIPPNYYTTKTITYLFIWRVFIASHDNRNKAL